MHKLVGSPALTTTFQKKFHH